LKLFPGLTAELPWLDDDEFKEDSFLAKMSIRGKNNSLCLVAPRADCFLLLYSKLRSIGSISSSILGTGEPENEDVDEFRGLSELLK